MRLEPLANSETGSMGVIGNTFINVWRATPTVQISRLRRPSIERVGKTYTSFGMLSILVSEQTHTLPGADYRAESKEQMAMLQHMSGCVATVVQMQSFMSSLVRTFLRGQNRLAGGSFRFETFDEVAGAAGWLSGALGSEGPSDAEIVAAATELLELR